jgi:pimeloyl-ACP methyl ester carboxylesterase
MRRVRTTAIIAVAFAASAAAQQPAHKFMTASDGVKIHYMELAGPGTPVMLIHGYTANAEGKWFKSGLAQALAAKHRVVAIDARGHGQSDKPHDATKYGPRMADRPNARTHRLKRELKNFQLVVLEGDTLGSAHLNPTYKTALVKFIDEP